MKSAVCSLVLLTIVMGFAHASDFRLKYFDYDPYHAEEPMQKLEEHDSFVLWRGMLYGKDPTTTEEMDVPFFYFQNSADGPRPLIIMMPPIEGLDLLTKDAAGYFANRGFNVIIAMLNDNIADLNRPISDVDNFLIRTTVSVRMLLDYAQTRPEEIDMGKIAAYGVSLGGIRTALAYGVEERFNAAWTFVAGGDVPEILTRSDQPIIEDYRRERIYREYLYDEKDFHRRLSRFSTIDPLDFGQRRPSENIYMVKALLDRAVPTSTQYKLWEEFGHPPRARIFGGHMTAVFSYRFFLGRIVHFFNDRLGVDNEKHSKLNQEELLAREQEFLQVYIQNNPLPERYQLSEDIRIEFD